MNKFFVKVVFSVLTLCSSVTFCKAQEQMNFVFKNGEGNYECYRIPAIIKAPNGDLLAYAEARKKGCNDI